MKVIFTKFLSLALAVAGIFVQGARAEDIDLYVSGNAAANAPNLLIFLDNSSNWAAAGWNLHTKGNNIGAWENCNGDTTCQGYVTQIFGSNTSLAQGQVEAGALKLVLNALVCGSSVTNPLNINVGFMFFQPANDLYSTNDGSGKPVTNTAGGYIRQAVLPLTQARCPTLIADLDAIIGNINSPAFKTSSSASYGEPLYEVFKYFGGYTNPANAVNQSPTVANDGAGAPTGHIGFGPTTYEVPTPNNAGTYYEDTYAFVNQSISGATYASPIGSGSCAKNYLLVVGNNWPNPDNSSLLTNLGVSATPICCAGSSATQNRLGDVWTKFLNGADVSPIANQQQVLTYSLNVYAPGTQTNTSSFQSQQKLLTSMAVQGGTGLSGYYEVNGNMKTLVDSFRDIFTSIAAVNSVFASSSLPVSVNTQGTYVNQVFIGMFRPDSDARERWNGNLKQYQFAIDSATSTLYLADAQGNPAVDDANTGFIRQCAVSFWTTDSSSYWQNVPTSQTPATSCTTNKSAGFPYSDMPDGNIVEKGAAGEWLRSLSCGSTMSPTYCGRNIKSCADTSCVNNSGVVNFTSANVTLPVTSHTSYWSTACDYSSADLVNWVAGGNLGDGPPALNTSTSGTTTCIYNTYNLVDATLANKVRPTAHGDVVHSRPLALNYATGTTAGSQADVVVFYGAGDGMLHAIDGNQTTTTAGQELWAFVAPEFFPKFQRLRDGLPLIAYPTVSSSPTPQPRDYFFDGGIGAYQERDSNNNLTKVYVYPAMRRGGRMVYAFNATNRPSATNSPSLMWKFGCPNANNDTGCVPTGGHTSKIGQTWSTPRIVRLKGDSNLYVVFGAGYDTCEDTDPTTSTMCNSSGMVSASSSKGTGIFVVNATTGAEVAYIDLTAVDNTVTAGRVIADVVPVDVNYDGYVDLLYAVDTRGNVWRVNTSTLSTGAGVAPASWTTQRLAYVADWSDSTQYRKLMYSPDVVVLGGTAIVLFGSGDREHPLGTSSAATVNNRFYGLRDTFAATTPPTNIKGINCDAPNDTILNAGCDLLNVTNTSLNYSTAILSSKGWVFDLATASNGSTTKEQVVTTPTTAAGTTYFSTFQPTDPNQTYQCSNLGTARGYAVNFLTGGTVGGAAYRQITFVGGGIPPSPVSGVVDVNGTLVPFILGGGTTGSPLDAGKVTTTVSQVRKKVYRYKQIDSQ